MEGLTKHKLSPFEYQKNLEMVEEYPKSERLDIPLSQLFSNKHYGRVEYVLLESLYFYPVLLSKNMEQFANHRLKDRKWADYQNIIKRLWKEGFIRRFNYGSTRFYMLTDLSREYMEQELKPKHKVTVSVITPSEILECASLSQWHLSLVLNEKSKQNYFYQQVALKKEILFIPSFVEIKREKRTYKVISVSIPKVKENMEGFLKEIEALYDKLYSASGLINFNKITNTYQLLVFIAESLEEMEQFAKILKEMHLTSKWPVYFVLETNSTFTNGLNLLYQVRLENGKAKTTTISIKD